MWHQGHHDPLLMRGRQQSRQEGAPLVTCRRFWQPGPEGTGREMAGAMSSEPQVPRRSILSAGGVGWLALGATLGAGTWATARFMRPNPAGRQDEEVDAGPVERYASLSSGTISDAVSDQGIWIARTQGRIVAIHATCTHLGCRVAWVGNDARFRCPCHGSSFDLDGTNLDGPAPRPLEHLAIRVQDGRVIIDSNRRFRKERGEWEHPDSFIRA